MSILVIRCVFDIGRGAHIDRRESAAPAEVYKSHLHRYASNRLRVVPQLRYHPSEDYATDLGLFPSALPVVGDPVAEMGEVTGAQRRQVPEGYDDEARAGAGKAGNDPDSPPRF